MKKGIYEQVINKEITRELDGDLDFAVQKEERSLRDYYLIFFRELLKLY